ncbi:SET domain-containing protein SmydA-8-like isoform X2 [Belonocnema kinseyi]|nr:SET domain-containing protein SmydA-8-like isoform X2 [Belonocnema kinseyi]
MCVNCCKVDCSLFPCERGCGLPVCSNECENSPKHIRLECDYLRSLKPTCDSTGSIDLLQAVVPIRSLTFSEDEKKLLHAFECHPEVQMGREVELLKKNVKINPSEEEEALMLRVSRVMDTTCFETAITTNKSSASLRALYPLGALQNHSCIPNTRHHFDSNQRAIVSAALPIKKGEEITMTYTDLLWDTTLRRHFLKVTKYFSCKCERCADKVERGSMLGALKCAEADCPGDLLPEDSLDFNSAWICGKCQLRISGRQIKSIKSGIGAIMEEMQYKSPRQIQKFIETELRVLVPATNCTMLDMKFRVISLFGRIEGLSWKDLTDRELNIKGNYCNELLNTLDLLGCGACKKKGLILYELYRTNEEKLSRLASRPMDDCEFSEADLIDNESILREASEILQEDIAAPEDYHCKIRNNHEIRTFQSEKREGSLSNAVM